MRIILTKLTWINFLILRDFPSERLADRELSAPDRVGWNQRQGMESATGDERMKAETIGRAIAVASVAFGMTDMLLGRRFGRGIGAGSDMGGRLFQVVGAREVATGVAGLLAPSSAVPVQWRLAGDAFDLAALAYIAAPANPRRKMAFVALGIVAGVALADLLGARALTKEKRNG